MFWVGHYLKSNKNTYTLNRFVGIRGSECFICVVIISLTIRCNECIYSHRKLHSREEPCCPGDFPCCWLISGVNFLSYPQCILLHRLMMISEQCKMASSMRVRDYWHVFQSPGLELLPGQRKLWDKVLILFLAPPGSSIAWISVCLL